MVHARAQLGDASCCPGVAARSTRNCFDALRLLAALAVVVQHSVVHLGQRFLWVDPYDPWWFYDGVPAFFILSGYFVYRSALCFERRREFLRNRALRVVPALWAYLAVSVLVLVTLRVITVRELASVPGLAWVGSTLALVPVYNPGILREFGIGVLNGSLWTIPVEVSFYLLLALVVVRRERSEHRLRRLLIGLLSAGAVGLILATLLGDSVAGKLLGVTFLPHLAFFGLGMAWRHVEARWQPGGQHALIAALLYVCVCAARGQVDSRWHLLATAVAAAPLSVVLMYVGRRGPSFLSGLTSRVGDLSYGAYIWHMPVVNLMLWSGMAGRLPDATAPAGALALTAVIAWLSWRVIEKPSLALKTASSRSTRTDGVVRAVDGARSGAG